MTLAEQEQEQQQHSFPFVLHGILRTTSPDIITWTSKGRAFGIKDMKRFCNEVLSISFKHAKFSSFQRQLNLYGFRKVVRGSEAGCYMHPDFQRDDTSSLAQVKRGHIPPCPAYYEDRIYGCGDKMRKKDGYDSEPELKLLRAKRKPSNPKNSARAAVTTEPSVNTVVSDAPKYSGQRRSSSAKIFPPGRQTTSTHSSGGENPRITQPNSVEGVSDRHPPGYRDSFTEMAARTQIDDLGAFCGGTDSLLPGGSLSNDETRGSFISEMLGFMESTLKSSESNVLNEALLWDPAVNATLIDMAQVMGSPNFMQKLGSDLPASPALALVGNESSLVEPLDPRVMTEVPEAEQVAQVKRRRSSMRDIVDLVESWPEASKSKTLQPAGGESVQQQGPVQVPDVLKRRKVDGGFADEALNSFAELALKRPSILMALSSVANDPSVSQLFRDIRLSEGETERETPSTEKRASLQSFLESGYHFDDALADLEGTWLDNKSGQNEENDLTQRKLRGSAFILLQALSQSAEEQQQLDLLPVSPSVFSHAADNHIML